MMMMMMYDVIHVRVCISNMCSTNTCIYDVLCVTDTWILICTVLWVFACVTLSTSC